MRKLVEINNSRLLYRHCRSITTSRGNGNDWIADQFPARNPPCSKFHNRSETVDGSYDCLVFLHSFIRVFKNCQRLTTLYDVVGRNIRVLPDSTLCMSERQISHDKVTFVTPFLHAYFFFPDVSFAGKTVITRGISNRRS